MEKKCEEDGGRTSAWKEIAWGVRNEWKWLSERLEEFNRLSSAICVFPFCSDDDDGDDNNNNNPLH